MLSPLDDYPIHQVAQPVRQVATSDRNFYDRYYFNCHASSPELFCVIGMGQYPNLGVSDAFATVRKGDEQLSVRASRELGADRMDTTVGPFRIEVLEGLRRLRVVLEPTEHDLAFDLTFTGAVAPVLEPRHVLRQPQGRVIIDSSRLAQTGTWSGTLTVAGTDYDVTPDVWQGTRDRSWGIRPVGEPEPPGYAAAQPPESFYWLYAPLRFDEFSIITILQEDGRGRRSLEEAVRVWPESSGKEPEPLGRPEVALTFTPGTREVATAVLDFADGPKVEVECVLPVALGAGAGYGTDDWRHGMYLGELEVQGRGHDVGDAAKRAAYFSVIDNLARARCEGRLGWGLFEFACFGPHEPSGFTGWDDVA
ncbi:hypothetical protein [Haloechinothrix salitolerans]|uniref:Uncharacterized protein n=1 Tax=Haloechinothrix salitolerans TaxID=926830 RepID=A0ABW2BVI9_9PSEU